MSRVKRHSTFFRCWLATVLALMVGCQSDLLYLRDEDVSHYVDVATDIAYPDIDEPAGPSVMDTQAPHTLSQPRAEEIWDLPLEEVIRIAMLHGDVIPNLGGLVMQNPNAMPTIYDQGIRQSDPRFSVEGALSEFDTNLVSGITWSRADRPVNNAVSVGNFYAQPDVFIFQEDSANFRAELNKTTPAGTRLALRNRIDYRLNNASSNFFPSAYDTSVELELRQPLLQGAGVDFGRIAGPRGSPGNLNGVVLARINEDIASADFQQAVRNWVSSLEDQYWLLYYAYRELDAQVKARDAAHRSWEEADNKLNLGLPGGSLAEVAQARQQYLRLEAAVQATLGGSQSFVTETSVRGGLYGLEGRLRRLMGLPVNDNKIIRPIDQPITIPFVPDWDKVLTEALIFRSELREQKWRIKRRQAELSVAKNFLYPQLDVVGAWRYNGLGDRLTGDNDNAHFQNSFETLSSGDYIDWQMGVQMSMPIGLRRAFLGVQNAELSLARERKLLQAQEMEISQDLADAIRLMDASYERMRTNLENRAAALQRLRAMEELHRTGSSGVGLDDVLRAQEEVARAETSYFRSAVDHTLTIKQLHFEKGTLLQYNQIQLSEGVWSEEAYDDAYQRARERSNARRVGIDRVSPPPLVKEGLLGSALRSITGSEADVSTHEEGIPWELEAEVIESNEQWGSVSDGQWEIHDEQAPQMLQPQKSEEKDKFDEGEALRDAPSTLIDPSTSPSTHPGFIPTRRTEEVRGQWEQRR